MDNGSDRTPTTDLQVAFDAPIVSVAVYPQTARITRRGNVHVSAATVEAVLPDLPRRLDADSVRVTGRGAIRVLGVDVRDDHKAAATETAVVELEAERDALRRRLAELADADEAQQARRGFLDVVTRTGAAALARSLAADPTADPTAAAGRLTAVSDLLVAQVNDVQSHRRTITSQREAAELELAAVERAIAGRRGARHPDGRRIVVALEPTDPGAATATGLGVEAELDVSYVVPDAGWMSVYDARLDGEQLTLTWFGLVTQRTGEDWPTCDLTLSTARPATGTRLPELGPWFVGAAPQPYGRGRAAASESGGAAADLAADGALLAAPMALTAAAPGGPARAAASVPPPAETMTAALDASGTAASYRLGRPVPVPADGSPHRATVASLQLDVALDYLTVPKLAPVAHLRATVTNTTDHTFRPGKVSIFHGQEFVGSSRLDTVAPGAEFELHLGVDDRLTVERELVRRNTGKRMVGNTRRTDLGYRVTLANHTGRPARVTLTDQVPVSANADVEIRDEQTAPNPDERSELGILTWMLELTPGQERHVDFGFRVEHPRDAYLPGF